MTKFQVWFFYNKSYLFFISTVIIRFVFFQSWVPNIFISSQSILHQVFCIYIFQVRLCFFASTWERTCFDQNFLLGGFTWWLSHRGGGGGFIRKKNYNVVFRGPVHSSTAKIYNFSTFSWSSIINSKHMCFTRGFFLALFLFDVDNNGVENLVRRILNSVNDIWNSGNGVNASTNGERQGQNEETRSIADIAGPVPNSTQHELYRRFCIPRDNGTQSKRGERSSNTTNAELFSRQYNPSHNYYTCLYAQLQ